MSQDIKSPYQLNRCEQLLVSKIREKTNLKLKFTHLLNGIAQQMAHLIKRKLIKSPADLNVIIESIPFIKKYQITCDICGYDVHNSAWLQTFVNSSKFQEIQNSEAENFGIGTLSLKSKKIIIVVICAQFNVQIDHPKMINVINQFPPNSIQIDKQQFLKKINEFRKQHSLSELLLVQSISTDKKPTDLKIFTVYDVPNDTDDFLFCLSQRSFSDFVLSPIHEIQLDVVTNENSTYNIIIKALFDYQIKSTRTEIEQEPIDFESEQGQPPVIEHNEPKANEQYFHDEEPADDEDFEQNVPLTEKSSERNNVEHASNINKEDQLNEKDETIEEEESDDSDPIQPIHPQSVNDNVNTNEQENVIEKVESDGSNQIQPGQTNSNQNISDENQEQIEEEESENSDPIQPIPPQPVNDDVHQNEQENVIEKVESGNSNAIQPKPLQSVNENEDQNEPKNVIEEEESENSDPLQPTTPQSGNDNAEQNEQKSVMEEEKSDNSNPIQPKPPQSVNENEDQNEQKDVIEEEESDNSDPIQPIPPQSGNENVNSNEQKDVIEKVESDGSNEIHSKPPQSVNENEDQNEQKDVIEEEESDNSDSNPNVPITTIQTEEKNNNQVLLNTTDNNIISFPTEHNEKKDVIEKVEIDPNEPAQPVPPPTENEINPKEKVDIDPQLNEKQEKEQPNATSLNVSQPQSTEEVKATPKEITTPSVPKTSSIPLTPQNSNDTLKTPEDCISLALTTIQQKLRNLDTQLDPEVTSKLQAYLEENNEFFYEKVRPPFLKAQFSSMIPHYEYSYIFGSQSYQYLRKDLIEKINHYGNVAAIACTRTFSRDGAPSTRFNIVLLIQRKDKSAQNSNNPNFVTTPKKDRQQMKSRSSTPRKDSILTPIEQQIVHQLSTIANSFEVIEEYTLKLRTLLQETNGNKQAIIDKAQNEFPSVAYIFIRSYFRLSHDDLLKKVHTEYSRLDKLQNAIVGVSAICADDNPDLFTAAVLTGKRGGTPRKNGSLATSQTLSTPKPETPKSLNQSQQYKLTPKSASRKVPNDYERSRLILSSLNEHRKKNGLPEAKLVPGLLPIAEEYTRDMGQDHIIMQCGPYEEKAKRQFPQYHNILACGMCKMKNSSYIERMFEHPDNNFMRILNSSNENISIGYWNKEKESVYIGIFSWTDK